MPRTSVPKPRQIYSICQGWCQKRQDAQLWQTDRAARCVIVLAKSGRVELRQYFMDTVSLSSTLWYNWPENLSNSVKKKRKIRAITAFKVIEVGTNRKPACDFQLVINSNWHPISYRFGVIAAYCPNFFHTAFLSHVPFEGLGTTYDVHLGLNGKRIVDFLLVLIELFSLGVTVESLRAKKI